MSVIEGRTDLNCLRSIILCITFTRVAKTTLDGLAMIRETLSRATLGIDF